MKQKQKIKGVVFDLGGVVLNNFEERFYGEAGKKLGISARLLVSAAQKCWPDLEKGRDTNLSMWNKSAVEMRLKKEDGQYLAALWLKHYPRHSKINRPVLAQARRLRRNFKVAALSNTQREHVIFNRKRKLFDNFDVSILSSEVGLRKPEKSIFILAAQRLRLPLGQLLFIDDDIRWVKAARRYGLQALRYVSAAKLEKDLLRLGLLQKR
jgi:glucose-1-phosphatase